MQKDLLKLALTGLAAGICLSAQGSGEIAMAKCSRTPPPPAENPTDPQMMDDTYPDDDRNDGSSCGSQGGSCASSYGGQGDQSSQNEAPSLRNFLEPKRLSAAKAVIESDNG